MSESWWLQPDAFNGSAVEREQERMAYEGKRPRLSTDLRVEDHIRTPHKHRGSGLWSQSWGRLIPWKAR